VRALLGHTGSDAQVACSPQGTSTTASDQQKRWTLTQTLLNDASIDPADRVSGCLVLLYTQPVSRIATFSQDDVSERDNETYLSFAHEPVLMPEPLGRLVRELPTRRQTGPSGMAPARRRWLFPGRNAGAHQHPEYIRARLKRLGIDCRANRNAALLQLAAELPPVVIASLLGLHPTTAVRWSQAAGANWTGYAARKLPHAYAAGNNHR